MRLARALRDLAAALEATQAEDSQGENNWEVVGESEEGASSEQPPSSSLPQPKSKAKAKSSGPRATGSTVAYREDWRCYVIVGHPSGLLGFVEGPGATTWRKIESSLLNQRLAGSGARLRRVANKEEALDVWRAAHGRVRPMPDLHL